MQMNMFDVPDGEVILSDAKLHYTEQLFSSSKTEQLFSVLHGLNWHEAYITLYGETHKIPRLQCFYGDELSYVYSNTRFKTEKWQAPLLQLKKTAEQYVSETMGESVNFNCMLGNLYRNGQDCMGWHADDEPELGFEPIIASYSFGISRDFKMKHKYNSLTHTFSLNNGSLLIMAGKTQEFWYHSLPKRARVTQPRINLTFRTLLKHR
ncbi:alpha-ketoglutarate-dependent dioxygenase AlkB family protein [Algibacillus agarilyticus]|uniref:alpha-ketoglutarate-dependent dioxygenase AlkB family protein n=1 Tax=Algibacillus agarilyticus TaxID=2234133 RepID=UPI000DD0A8D8|nr:alpha-ketoglutarate-dependent dioxygenase AlkB [Algibacillus agarilyticus]